MYVYSRLTCLCSLYSVLSRRLHCILTVGASFTLLDWYVSSLRRGHPIASVMRTLKTRESSRLNTHKPFENFQKRMRWFTKMFEGIVLIIALEGTWASYYLYPTSFHMVW